MKRIKYGDIWGKPRSALSLVQNDKAYKYVFVVYQLLLCLIIPIKYDVIPTFLHFYGGDAKAVVIRRGITKNIHGRGPDYLLSDFLVGGVMYRCTTFVAQKASAPVPGDTISVKYLKANPKIHTDEISIGQLNIHKQFK